MNIVNIPNDYYLNFLLAIYSNNRNTYIEFSDVNNGKPGVFIPLSKKQLSDIMNVTGTSLTSSFEIFDKRVLFVDHSSIVWYIPEGSHKLIFRKETKAKTNLYHLPGMLFHYANDELNVYFTDAKNKRPNNKTILYHCQLPNVTNGQVCMGSSDNNVSKDSINDIVNSYTNAFFNSEFTHSAASFKKRLNKTHYAYTEEDKIGSINKVLTYS